LWSVANELTSRQSRIELTDTPLGFGFSVEGSSNDVFNTLKMDDNKIAIRFFKDKVVPFLRELPEDLKATGGENAFQSVSVLIRGHKKDFAEKYAVDSSVDFKYVFRISDVESFVSQKIDAQQLLDRGHITQDDVGRIALKYTGE
jgi:hypothetical protein